VGFQCPIGAKNGTQNSVIPVALASGNCELRIRAMVTELVVDDAGKLTGVRYVDEEDKVHEITAKVVVVAGGSNATARLLMTSRSKLFPDGAGNNNDMVGRNITSHAYVDARGFMDHDLYSAAGPGTGTAFMDFSHDNEGFIGGGVFHSDFRWVPSIFATAWWKDAPTWGKANKDFIRTHHGKGVAKYFYISYKNEHPDEEVDIEKFSYPGPNPFTKEQAILMMADAVEAASRSLPEYTEENISTLIEKIVDGQVAEGYFKECPITFKDIALVKALFKEKLKTVYHTRITYPELKK
jgi:hypothetical protein